MCKALSEDRGQRGGQQTAQTWRGLVLVFSGYPQLYETQMEAVSSIFVMEGSKATFRE